MLRFNAGVVVMMAGLVGALAHCGSSADNKAGAGTAGGAASGTGADSQAAQQASGAADDAGATDGVGAQRQSTFMALEAANRLLQVTDSNGTASFKVGDCSAQLAYDIQQSNANVVISATETFSNSNCTGQLKLSGSQNIVINTSLLAGQRIVTVSGTLTRTLDGNDQILIETLDPALDYAYKLEATGVQAGGNATIQVHINEHRVRSANGNAVFDHNVFTTDANGVVLVAAYSTTGTQTARTLASGEVDVHHNLDKFLAKHTFSNLYHDTTGSCACPSAGSITQVVTSDASDWTYTRLYTFTGCGKATVTTSGSTKADTANGSADIVWDGCTN